MKQEPTDQEDIAGRGSSIIVAFDWHDQRVYEGIFQFAKSRGWHLSPYLFSSRFVPHGWPGEGAITCWGKSLSQFILSLDMPKVDITVDDIPQRIPRVVVDNQAVGRLAAKHFLKRGFQHFAIFSWRLVKVNSLRHRAFMRALLEAGVPPDRIHVIHQSPGRILGHWERHQEHIHGQLDKLPRPLAVFTGQDNLAATLIEICCRTGIAVPEEIAVLGVDNLHFLCEGSAVPMSSIDTRLTELGYVAAEQLDRVMRGRLSNPDEVVKIPPKGVVTRRSTEILAVPHAAVAKALTFMKENSREPITLEDIGEHVGMSKRGLEKAFLKHMSLTPAGELRRIRLDKAKRMLTETDEKIQTIARECGYSNSSNLSLALNRDSGLSPRGYRRKFRAAE